MRVKHEACPECRKIGKDTKGDNLAVYPDGGKFCFACGYHESGTKYSAPQEARRRNFSESRIPEYSSLYLEKVLSKEEIDKHFTFDYLLGRIVLRDTLPEFYWGKSYFGANGQKVLTFGEVPFHVFGEHEDTLVVVEDPISAIVVSRGYACLPLFGAYFPPRWYHNLTVCPFKKIIFWLDKDKAKESLSLALSLRHLFKTGMIWTEKDPKYYSLPEINAYVNRDKENVAPNEQSATA